MLSLVDGLKFFSSYMCVQLWIKDDFDNVPQDDIKNVPQGCFWCP